MADQKKEPDASASAMAKKRWEKTTAEERLKVSKKMTEARWGTAASRAKGKKAAGKKAAKKAGK